MHDLIGKKKIMNIHACIHTYRESVRKRLRMFLMVLIVNLFLVSSSTSYRILSSISFPSLLVHTVTDDGFSSRLASFLLFFQEKILLPASALQDPEQVSGFCFIYWEFNLIKKLNHRRKI